MDNIDKKLEELAKGSADGINPVELWMREVINERESGVHRGRYNETGDGGEDIYDISKKAREHISEIKKRD